jgi:hypothetical protein
MARERKTSTSRTTAAPAGRARNLKRPYVVVEERDDGTLKVLDAAREAKSPQEAMDAVAEGMPPEQRTVKLGAFLAGSYKSRKYGAQQQWVTNAEDAPAGFERPVRAVAATSAASSQAAAAA